MSDSGDPQQLDSNPEVSLGFLRRWAENKENLYDFAIAIWLLFDPSKGGSDVDLVKRDEYILLIQQILNAQNYKDLSDLRNNVIAAIIKDFSGRNTVRGLTSLDEDQYTTIIGQYFDDFIEKFRASRNS